MNKKLLILLLFISGCGFSTLSQDLDNAVTSLGLQVSSTTIATNLAIDLLNKTNVTQSAVLVAGVVTAAHGTNVDLPLTLIPGPLAIAALQFNILVPAGIGISSVTAGPVALASGKSVAFSTGTQAAIVFGLNQTAIPLGVVAIAHLSISTSSALGFYSFGLVSPIAADPKGNQIPLSLTSGSIIVK